jgi:hypothetical protein
MKATAIKENIQSLLPLKSIIEQVGGGRVKDSCLF